MSHTGVNGVHYNRLNGNVPSLSREGDVSREECPTLFACVLACAETVQHHRRPNIGTNGVS